jgi:hypothetical protein
MFTIYKKFRKTYKNKFIDFQKEGEFVLIKTSILADFALIMLIKDTEKNVNEQSAKIINDTLVLIKDFETKT